MDSPRESVEEESLGAARRFLHDTYDSDKRYCPRQALCMSNAIIERVSRLVPAGPDSSRLTSVRRVRL